MGRKREHAVGTGARARPFPPHKAARGPRNWRCSQGRPSARTEARREAPAVLLDRYRATAVAMSREMVALTFALPVEAMAGETRGCADVAFARQVAMYLAHTVFGVSQSQVAFRFRRDRSTVRHACALVEDARDDPELNGRLLRLEALLGVARDGVHAFAHALNDRTIDNELQLHRAGCEA